MPLNGQRTGAGFRDPPQCGGGRLCNPVVALNLGVLNIALMSFQTCLAFKK